MSEVIYKYPLPISDRAVVKLPRNAHVVHIGEEASGGLAVWAMVDPNHEPEVDREFLIFGTGQPIADANDLEHRVTVVMRSGLVWHIFEEVLF